jgi:peptidyl-prolyl cis-trans isomerase A (cyclophilin A)
MKNIRIVWLACATWLSVTPHVLAGDKVNIITSAGTIQIELENEKAPITTSNFLQYIKSGHYQGTTFHRVVKDFMIQGGGLTEDLVDKPTLSPIRLESRNGLRNQRGTVAMARTGMPDSATSQFFINLVDNRFLDWDQSRDGRGYAVFGHVTKGMDIVDKISQAQVSPRGTHQHVPTKPIIIQKTTLEP